jgi:hypothetical protein
MRTTPSGLSPLVTPLSPPAVRHTAMPTPMAGMVALTPEQVASAEALYAQLLGQLDAEFDADARAEDTPAFALDSLFPSLAAAMDRKHKVERWLYAAHRWGMTDVSFDELLHRLNT